VSRGVVQVDIQVGNIVGIVLGEWKVAATSIALDDRMDAF
jgi:hypothetical protein